MSAGAKVQAWQGRETNEADSASGKHVPSHRSVDTQGPQLLHMRPMVPGPRRGRNAVPCRFKQIPNLIRHDSNKI
eukprot:CAMPEP_0204355714 /NCGR_PEP_ID=MMETSP0469-20131031/34375_1 /ASSEMBLY_ACC=CAM_ASM_000384 /TAXON_ID=2969 /ORGANISM="Oxyrrhis marina" /LENGTH=74 /DNA_ID=CAMNT_0051343025 /DNA_START=474 /DNA_END=698 /DNA_ORIENTATION=-